MSRVLARTLVIVVVLFVLPVGCMVAARYSGDGGAYAGYSRHGSTGQAPEIGAGEAAIQVYAARAARWRGAFGVHTWIATRRTDDDSWTRLEVIGYRIRYGGGAVQVRSGTPDGMWFGSYPVLLREVRGGNSVDAMIDRLHDAAESYPYDDTYHVWPGPNSNTFVAWLARAVPELRLELPANAIGKDYLPNGAFAARAPSGTGVQLSLGGYIGVLAGLEEGIELDLMSLSVGVDLWPPAVKLPGVGRLGFPDFRRYRFD